MTFLRQAAAALIAVLPGKMLLPLLHALARRLEKAQKVFFTYHLRPVYPAMRSACRRNEEGVSIVMQGPLVLDHDFTLETVRLYHRNYPGAHIVVSTWMNSAPDQLSRLREAGAEVRLSVPPGIPGIANINFQRVSTASGLAAARERESTYVLKCRTDQRFFAPDLFVFMRALQTAFPVNGTVQMDRLIATSLNSFKYRPYSISDMFVFGRIEDVCLLWDIPEDPRTSPEKGESIFDWSRAEMAEVYIVANFLRRLGREPAWTLSDSWRVYADHFCIMDASTADLYWPKYERLREFRSREYAAEMTNAEMTWKDWLAMHTNPWLLEAAPEEVLHLPFGAAIPNGNSAREPQ